MKIGANAKILTAFRRVQGLYHSEHRGRPMTVEIDRHGPHEIAITINVGDHHAVAYVQRDAIRNALREADQENAR